MPDREKDKAPHPPAPAPAVREDVHVSVNRCPFCHDDVQTSDPAALVCRGCLARHHGACWAEGGRCGACGGQERLVAAAAEGPSTPRRLGLTLGLALACLIALFATLGALAPDEGRARPAPSSGAPRPAQPTPRAEGAREFSLRGLDPRDVDSLQAILPELAGVDRIPGVRVALDRDAQVVRAYAPPANLERVARALALVHRLGTSEGRSFVAQHCRVWVVPLGANKSAEQGRSMAALVHDRLGGAVDAEYEPESHSLVLFGARPDLDWAQRELHAAEPR